MSTYEERDRIKREERRQDVRTYTKTAGVALVVVLLLFAGGCAGSKKFSVWSREQDGKAAIAEARYSKQVQVAEAEANLEAEKLNAQAELERAKGAAKAMEAEGGALTPEYITYLWVRNLERGDNHLIYVPTEGGLPILEAGRAMTARRAQPEPGG